MKRLLRVVLFGSGLDSLGVPAIAQPAGRYPYNAPRADPYPNNGFVRSQQFVIDRVMADLNRAASGARLDNHERKHGEEVARNLRDFQQRAARGKFDNGKLDKAIENLQHLADSDRVR